MGVWSQVFLLRLTCHVNKTIHALTTITTIIELSGRGEGRWYNRLGGWNKNTTVTSSEYSITRRFNNIRAGCPGWEPDTLRPAGTEEGIGLSAYIHVAISHGDRAKEDCRSDRRHTGTVEGIGVRLHVANSHGDRAKEGRRSNFIAVAGVRISACSGGSTDVSKGAN